MQIEENKKHLNLKQFSTLKKCQFRNISKMSPYPESYLTLKSRVPNPFKMSDAADEFRTI